MTPRDEIIELLESSIRYHLLARHESAEIAVRDALKKFRQAYLSENDVKAEKLFLTANPLVETWEFERATPILEEAFQLNPLHQKSYIALLRCRWCLGQYKEFWKLHEERRRFYDNLLVYERIFGKEKSWSGQELAGKTVLIYCEMGMGDQIQFVRYIPAFKKKHNCQVILVCAAALGPLFKQLDFADQIVFKEHVSLDRQPEHDYHLPLMSLPYYLEMWEPLDNPYRWSAPNPVFLKSDKVKIGFVFTPNPRTFETPYKTLNVSWIKEAMIPGVNFYNLHHSDPCHIEGVIDLCEHINDFGDLANWIEAMDLILGVDSAILHLAGSLGKKTIGLIARNGNWRWGTEKTSSWYPSVQLIHQSRPGDWSGVLESLRLILEDSLHQ